MKNLRTLTGLALALAVVAVPALAQNAEVAGTVTGTSPAPVAGPTWPGPEGTVLFDNGPLVNGMGTGVGGADESILQSVTLGLNILGFGHQVSAGNWMADDFTVDPGGWTVTSITFFAYQSFAPNNPSPLTAVNFQVRDATPPGGSVVIDAQPCMLSSTTFTNIYRVTETTTGANVDRAIFAQVCDINPPVNLAAGTYWINWQTDGSASFSGPWAPPITINGQATTGNALQSTDGGISYGPALDSGTNTQQGMPFIIEGTPQGDSDIEVSKSGQVSGGNVVYTVTVTNNGPDDATNVVVVDTPGPGQTYVSDDCGGMFAAPDWTWNVGALANGASAVCNITYALDAGVNSVSNSVSASADQMDPNPGNNATSITVSALNVLEIPTLGQWGLILLTLALLAAGMMLLVRRRTA